MKAKTIQIVINLKGIIKNVENLSGRYNVYRFIILLAIACYVTYWSIITIKKFYSLNADVWDLGYAVNLLTSISTTHWTLTTFLTQLSTQGIVFIIFPIALVAPFQSVLILQSFAYGLPALLIFEISYLETGLKKLSFLLGISYLLYFPLAGGNWFDFHFQTLFSFLFLCGYYSFLRGRYRFSLMFFMISSFVKFPYVILLTLFSIGFMTRFIFGYIKKRKIPNKKEFETISFLLAVSVFLFIFELFWINHINNLLITVHSSGNYSLLSDLNSKILAFLVLYFPLLFLPLVSKKWVLPTIPFLTLIFFANNSSFEYPGILMNWETVAIIPFLFLGALDTINIWYKRMHRYIDKNIQSKKRPVSIITKGSMIKRVPYFILIILVLCSFYYQPYGLLNGSSPEPFNVEEQTKINSTLFSAANSVISLVPQTAKYILVQNDLPQVFPKTYVSHILVAPYNIGPDVTNSDIKNNSFPFNGGSETGHIKINYVLANMNNYHSLTEPPTINGYPTMIQILQMLMESHYYGIVAEDNGIILLERNYTGNLSLYKPFEKSVNISNVYLPNSWVASDYVQYYWSFSTDESRLLTSYSLSPGEYAIKIQLSNSSERISNYTLKIIGSAGNSIYVNLGNTSYSYTNSINNTSSNVKVMITTTDFISNIIFNLSYFTNSYKAYILGFSIYQTKPPI